jgi:acyl-CoA thioester hydrolase
MTTAAAEKDSALPPAPFLSSVMQIEPQWIDYNGHLNMAYYNVMMDRAIDQMWLHLGIGPTYMKERHGSTFTAECHVRYLREIHLGDPVQVTVYLLASDEKRIHTFEELRHATEGWISATHPRPHPGGRGQPRRRAAARGHRPQGGDALEIVYCVRPACVRARGRPPPRPGTGSRR